MSRFARSHGQNIFVGALITVNKRGVYVITVLNDADIFIDKKPVCGRILKLLNVETCAHVGET